MNHITLSIIDTVLNVFLFFLCDFICIPIYSIKSHLITHCLCLSHPSSRSDEDRRTITILHISCFQYHTDHRWVQVVRTDTEKRSGHVITHESERDTVIESPSIHTQRSSFQVTASTRKVEHVEKGVAGERVSKRMCKVEAHKLRIPVSHHHHHHPCQNRSGRRNERKRIERV